MIKLVKVSCGRREGEWESTYVASVILNRCARLMSVVNIKNQPLCPGQRILVLLK